MNPPDIEPSAAVGDDAPLYGEFPTIYEGVTFRALAYDALARGAVVCEADGSDNKAPNLDTVLMLLHQLYDIGCLSTPIVRVHFARDCKSIVFDSFTTRFSRSLEYPARITDMTFRAEAKAKAGPTVPFGLPETAAFGRVLKAIDQACKHMIAFGTNLDAVGPMNVGAAIQWLDALLASADRPKNVDIFYRDRVFNVQVTPESTGVSMLQQFDHESNMQIAHTLAIEKLKATSICDQRLLDVCDLLGVSYPK